MRFFLLYTFVFLIAIQSHAQSVIEIQYHRFNLYLHANDTIGEGPAFYQPRMVFNDSFALVYYFSKTNNYKLKGIKIGHKLMHHGLFHNFITKEILWEIEWSRKEKYLVKDTTTSYQWQFFNRERVILDKVCQMAVTVGNNDDSIIVWYTRQLRFKNGPLLYRNIPGVILEVFDHKRHMRYVATEINESNIKLVHPQEGRLLTFSEWEIIRDARLKKLHRGAY